MITDRDRDCDRSSRWTAPPVVHWPSDPVPTGPNAPAGSLPTVQVPAPRAALPAAPPRPNPSVPPNRTNGAVPAAPVTPAMRAPVAQPPVPGSPVVYPPVDRSSAVPPEPIQPEQIRAVTGTMPEVRQHPVQPQPVSPPPVHHPPVQRPVSPPPPHQQQQRPPVVEAPEPVTAIPVTAITSSGPAPVVTPTAIVQAWRAPAWPAQPQLPAAHTAYQTGGYPVVHPTVHSAHTGGYPTVHTFNTGGYPAVHNGHHPVVLPAADGAAPRTRPPVGVLLLGLLVGLLVFGSTGYLIGSTSGESTVDGASATAGAGQEESNRRRVGPALVPLADAWVPWLGGCRSSSEAGGPAPEPGEQVRVRCSVNGTLDVFFIQFRSAVDRDKVRAARANQNATSARLAPGAAPVAAQRAGTSGRTTGSYVEFAYQADGRTYGGIYWDDSNATTGAYIEKQWTEGDGGWRPLRDLWQRYT